MFRRLRRIEAQQVEILRQLHNLNQRMMTMADNFDALTQTVSDIGQAVTDTATRVEADLAALQTASQANDQPTIDDLNSKLQDALTHLKAIGAAATTVSTGTDTTVPNPPASIADPSDPTTVDTTTTTE